MGLPGSGKTTFAEKLHKALINSAWFNADKIREMTNDWDFSDEGRTRQSKRMRNLADFESENSRWAICDFVCPTRETRKNFDADITIWMDTIDQGRFEDTNKLFQKPENIEYRITDWDKINIDEIVLDLFGQRNFTHSNVHAGDVPKRMPAKVYNYMKSE